MTNTFSFTERFDDARVAELRLLAWIDQHGRLHGSPAPRGRWNDLLISLVSDALLTAYSFEEGKRTQSAMGQGSAPRMESDSGMPGESRFERSMVIASVATLIALHRGEAVSLTLTHRGRVRLSELKQALRSGREREPLGILWDVRHWETDLEIALLDASPSSPVSVAYLDMNGLKQLNDTKGHAAGDEGLRAYFRSVLSAVGDDGLVYRLAGDEVLAVLPAVDAVNAVRAMERASRRLMSERFESLPDLKLSISAGLVCVTEAGAMPVTVRDAADKCQYRAKEESRKHSPRPSVIALENIPELTIIHVSTDLIS